MPEPIIIKSGRQRIAEDIAAQEAEKAILEARIRVNKRLTSVKIAPEGTDKFIEELEKNLKMAEVILDEYYQIVQELDAAEAAKQEDEKQVAAAPVNGRAKQGVGKT